MLAIACFALLIWLVLIWHHYQYSGHYSLVARHYHALRSEYRMRAEEAITTSEAARFRKLAADSDELWRIYNRASRYPWLPLPAGPPEPR